MGPARPVGLLLKKPWPWAFENARPMQPLIEIIKCGWVVEAELNQMLFQFSHDILWLISRGLYLIGWGRERLVLGDDMVEWLSINSERRKSAWERLKLGSIHVVEWLSSEFNQLVFQFSFDISLVEWLISHKWSQTEWVRETRVGRGCGWVVDI